MVIRLQPRVFDMLAGKTVLRTEILTLTHRFCN